MHRKSCFFFIILFIFSLQVVYAEGWQTLRKVVHPEILNASFVDKGVYEVFEILFSSEIRVVTVKQNPYRVTFHVIPAVKPIDFSIWKRFNANFSKFNIKQCVGYTEISVSSTKRLNAPYTSKLANGQEKIIIPCITNKSYLTLKKGRNVAKGVEYVCETVPVANGTKQTQVHLLKLAPSNFSRIIFPTLAHEGLAKKERLSSMCSRCNAVGGINAGFFSSKGDPLGILIIGRKLVSSPLYDRSVFGITDDNKVVVGNPSFKGEFKTGNLTIDIDAVNQPRTGDKLVVYTAEYAKSTMTEEVGTELILVKGKIVGIQSMNAAIPPDGIVVSAGGYKADMLENVKLGASTDIDYSVDKPWNSIMHAVCGGPRLLDEGNIRINGEEEKFSSSIITGRHPRTAIGITFDGHIIMLVADGRTQKNAGMTLKELASYMQKLGVRNAINLDGGGSSTMVIKNKVVNIPSDGAERPISNGILIVK